MTTKNRGLCGYCLGQGEVVVPVNDDPKEAELNNFHTKICPVCSGTKESISEDTFEDEDDDFNEQDVIISDDFHEFLEDDDEQEDLSSNDINNQS